jgi:hypothetical protein
MSGVKTKRQSRQQQMVDLALRELTQSNRLQWLVDRSLQVMDHLISGGRDVPELDDELPTSTASDLRQVRHDRFRAEFEIFGGDPGVRTGQQDIFEAEYQCLVKALWRLADRHLENSKLFLDLAKKPARGRPRATSPNALLAVALGIKHKTKVKGKAGRPPAVQISNEVLLKALADGKAANGTVTTRAIAKQLAASHLRIDCESRAVLGWRQRDELDRLRANLEKRASALQVRKQAQK